MLQHDRPYPGEAYATGPSPDDRRGDADDSESHALSEKFAEGHPLIEPLNETISHRHAANDQADHCHDEQKPIPLGHSAPELVTYTVKMFSRDDVVASPYVQGIGI
jgi:hypothetical protein